MYNIQSHSSFFGNWSWHGGPTYRQGANSSTSTRNVTVTEFSPFSRSLGYMLVWLVWLVFMVIRYTSLCWHLGIYSV